MGEKFLPNFENDKELFVSEKQVNLNSSNERKDSKDFVYDSKNQGIFICTVGESGEKKETRHAFQEFLYALREKNVKASTSEWIDLQKALAIGEVQSLDDFYIVARATLVKDVTDYSKFDLVFGRMFYNIEPPQEEQKDDYEEEQDIEEDQSEEDKKELEENQSQDIVEPGLTEEHHGGDDVHKAIKDSKSSGHEGGGKPQQKSEQEGKGQKNEGENGGQKEKEGESGGKENQKGEGGGSKKQEGEGGGKKKETGEGGEGKEKKDSGGGKRKEKEKIKGVIREGKGGYSARERVVERKYEQFDKEQILNYESFGRVLAKLTSIIYESSEIPTGKLDAQATVRNIAKNAGLPELIWREETEKKPKVILMFDVGGSTDEFRPIIEKLFAAAKDYLDEVEVYYFHNAIYGDVWPQKDGNYGKHFIPLEEILKKDPDSRIIIIGDAWMSEYELYNDFNDENGKYHPSGIDNFIQIRRNFDHSVWINPIKEVDHNEWDNSGTIAEIKNVFSMHDMTLNGLEKAVKELMEE